MNSLSPEIQKIIGELVKSELPTKGELIFQEITNGLTSFQKAFVVNNKEKIMPAIQGALITGAVAGITKVLELKKHEQSN